MSPRGLLERARARGLDCIAVTDHGSLVGARACAELAALDPTLPRVILGEEVETSVGEIIGLFVDEQIEEGLTLDETVRRIRAQGGVVYLPHPCDEIRRSAVHGADRLEAARVADVIEVRNGRSLRPAYDRSALGLAMWAGSLVGAGSDAHFPGEVGRAYLEVDRIPGRDDFIEVLRDARPAPLPRTAAYARSWFYLSRTKIQKVVVRRRRG